jgi:hypothetical protein
VIKINRIYFLCFIFITNCFSYCKKKDKEFPVINFISPASQTQYKVLETIYFKAEVSDNEKIESITISLLDANSKIIVSAFKPKDFENGSSKFQLSESIELLDKTISSGEYRIKISVSDGELSTSKELKILVDELPKKREAILFFLKNTNSINVYKTDSTNLISQIATLNGVLLGAKTFSAKKLVAVATNQPSQIAYYPYASFSNPFVVSNLEILSASANGDSLIYYSDRAGYTRALNDSYSQKNNFISSVENYYPSKIFESSSFLFCVQSNNFNQHFLEVRNKITGGILKTKDLSFLPLAIEEKNNNRIILLKSIANQTQLIEYDFINNTLSSIKDINENINYIKNLDANNLLISGDSKIYSYNFSTGFLGDYLPIGGFYQIEIDELNNQIIALKNGQLVLINKDSPSQNFIIPLPMGNGQVQILYNK